MRLTRDATDGPATNSKQYKCCSDKVDQELAFTYFYPALKPENQDYQIQWPWDNESLFRRRFLSSYASTALVYHQQAAEEGLLHEVEFKGLLHEVEFISPRTLDGGQQVYLVGYLFQKEGSDLPWQLACQRLQMGGERGYGWGDMRLIEIKKITDEHDGYNHRLFDSENYTWQVENNSIVIQVSENSSLLAHTKTENVSAQGEIEPLVGREWQEAKKAGESVAFSGMCWTPGTVVNGSMSFKIKRLGVWIGH
ncbi:hypothetical protein K4A83_00545 [Spirulina subsalsa FACHB-351]|uniref:Uncharacterized protein n=2 Tax=Spirulina subsalsa TaxID=54311 RepID=A0ABT3KZT7_9CYAN|nr:hypothetical protein [Spirulina subsalsa FACHB-351]